MIPLVAAIAIVFGVQSGTSPAERATKIVVKFDSPELPADAPDRLPRTIWRLGKNKSRIEGVVSAESGHRILVVTDSPHLWLADLDTQTGYHTVDPGPDVGADMPVFPVGVKELEDLQMGQEAAYFREHHAKSQGLTKMNGRTCERQDIQSETYLLLGCFEPMTNHPVALGLKIGEHVFAFNYLEYDTNAEPPPGAFEKPKNVKFTDKPHSDTTNAAH